jgi:nickel-dependent lactate racemase
MPQIDLKYGRTAISFELEESHFQVLGQAARQAVLSDVEIGELLDDPLDSARFEETVAAGDSVLIVVPDATRQTACGQIVNLLVRRLIAGGTAAHDIRIIFATGIHRKVTAEEKGAILTPFIAQRIKTLDHGARDLTRLVRLGETVSGIPIELDRALVEHDRVVIVGGVTFHYFAGFTGGRKLVCPGLASARTISETHKLAFDCRSRSRRIGVETGILDGNAVNEAFMEIVARIDPHFAINTVVNDAGQAVNLYCGDWRSSHRAACNAYAAEHTIIIDEKRELVIASCGGYPHDINMIQAHKALEAASHACNDGGTIILFAECSDGLGRDDFLNWFEGGSSEVLAAKLCKQYQVNGQTAWSLQRKAERFDVRIVTALPEVYVEKMALKKIGPQEALALAGNRKGFVIPNGAKFKFAAVST